uniref:Vacuolar protein sorting-associated protein 72 homolog n=1 Tax=Xenopsylla cheopis TaxID=163159 RepID=A0A6M2DUL2_XENCH
MASSRPKRRNAGNKMAKLLDEEEVDDFYSTTYGGFNEADEDNDYIMEKEVEDKVDSDFDIDEDDELVEDPSTIDEPKRKRKTFTKAYKDKPKKSELEKKKQQEQRPRAPKQHKTQSGLSTSAADYERKSTRVSTKAKSEQTRQRVQERDSERMDRKQAREEAMRRYKRSMKSPTQEERLAEAKITEVENLKSLDKYKQMEIEKKRCRYDKNFQSVPFIRYHSYAVEMAPGQTEDLNAKAVDVENGAQSEENLDVDNVDDKRDDETKDLVPKGNEDKVEDKDIKEENDIKDVETVQENKSSVEADDTEKSAEIINDVKMEADSAEDKDAKKMDDKENVESNQSLLEKIRYERTFISFHNDVGNKIYAKVFPRSDMVKPRRQTCPITLLPAKYFDPLTKTPYRDSQAFKILRESYYLYLENYSTEVDKEDEQFKAWLDMRKLERQNKLKSGDKDHLDNNGNEEVVVKTEIDD